MPNYSLLITSCDRFDLLKQTLDSFIAVGCGGMKPRDTFIVDDSDKPQPDWFKENWAYYSSHLGKITWVTNEARMGQIYSADRLWSLCTQDYACWLEDDWKFLEGHFMDPSFEILEKYPKVFTVSLRGDTGWHQLINLSPYPFKVAMPGWKGGWGGFTFNCGVRRKSDFTRLGSYGKHVSYGTAGPGHELQLSKKLLQEGCIIADLGRRIVEHTGGNRSRSIEPLPAFPKVLIAILACHQFEYGKWESGDSPSFNKAIAYNGEPYGTGIHISGENTRIEALRETWVKDAAKLGVDCKFFYGTPHNRAPLDDEVFLSCGDTYADLPAKTIEICRYAAARDIGFLFKCDDDSLIYIDRILQEVLGSHADYAGYLNGRVATGGTGYWLSKRAVKIIAEKASAGNHWAEDVTVSKCLFHHNIQGVHLAGHRTGRSDHWFWPGGQFDSTTLPADASAIHAVQPEVMRQWYAHKERP